MSDIAFATVDDFATRMGVVFTDEEKSRAHSLLLAASDLVESAANRRLSFIADDVLVRRGTVNSRIRLDGPVVSVTSIAYKTGTGATITLPAIDYFLLGDQLFRTSGQSWFDVDTVLTITYSHGYQTIHPVAAQIVLEVAVRVWVNPGSVAGEGHGGESASYQPGSTGLMLSDWERDRIKAVFGSSSAVRSVLLT